VWKDGPDYDKPTQRIAHEFLAERKILEYLDGHPKIVKCAIPYLTERWLRHDRYLGSEDDEIMLAEANMGNLQAYIDINGVSMCHAMRARL
jgi:hypothetical protein